LYCCGGAEEFKWGDGDAAATVLYAVKGSDGEEEKDGDESSALPHAVAPVGAPSLYSCGGAEERKGCDGGWERQARRRRGFMASGEVTANRAAARSRVGSVTIK
jgi:hypothetical protein